MRNLLVIAVIFGGLWLADTFGFNGYHAKQIRLEADREIFLANQQVENIIRAVAGR
jgi:hypothetical protein